MQLSEKIFFRVKEFVVKNGLIKKDESILLSLSGGADSVCLFHLLIDLQKFIPFSLRAVHVNHLLRATESAVDEVFCRELCKDKEIPLSVRKVRVASLANSQKVSLEVAGRNERYRVLKLMKNKYGADKIALAHHAGDQAETLCMRFFKGSMWEGLAGIKCRENSLIRPLLLLQKEEILTVLRSRKIPWREDASNADGQYMRSSIRNTILPLVQKHVNANVVQTLAEKASYFLEAQGYLQSEMERQWKKLVIQQGRSRIDLSKNLRRRKKFLRLGIIHRALKHLAGSHLGISLRHLEAADGELIKNIHGHSLKLVSGIEFRVGKDFFQLLRSPL